jgi:UDP:flavonoid glycosyltransferase YjiC (YdhE family)
MRILFSSLPTHGHTYPLVPLAGAARDAGHDVLFATGEFFHPVLKSFGMDTVAAGIGIYQAFVEANGGEVHRTALAAERRTELIGAVFGAVLPRAFVTDLVPLLDRLRPDLVVHEAGNLGGFFAAKLAGIPGICHGFGRVAGRTADFPIHDSLTAFAAELGVDFPDAARGGGDPYLDICPESVQDAGFLATAANRIPLRPVPVNEPGELPAWVLSRAGGRPLVYLTLGTAFGAIPVLKEAIDGLSAIDTDVLVAAGPTIDVDALGGVPANVRVEKWVPQADLLPHADLVVHHGGSGTTLGALANGVPQLVLPQGADQFGNAEAVVERGAGARLLTGDQTAEAVATKVKTLLTDDQAVTVARAVAAEIAAMPSPEDTVRVLEKTGRA